MASIRCGNCSLLNFSTETKCKRCKQPLHEYSNIADQRQYQENFEEARQPQPSYQNQPSHFQPYQTPPPPTFYENQSQPAMQMSCIKCGDRKRVSLQNFKIDYIPPISYVAFFMGILPGLILVSLLKVKHHLSAPFCGDCWRNFNQVSGKETLGVLACLGGFVVGIFAMFLFESVLIMLIFFGLGIALLIRGQLFKSKHSPKYKKVTRQEVIISDPQVGDVSFAR
jgi:hypothetical protein